ncbi:MAG: toll/interleukin-1 receptor domain-containing protein [bacterium]|nr:toll/interleukin-1 receptor domain-containing protein [bacterium]
MKIFISHISEEKKLALVLQDWIESVFLGQLEVFVSSNPDNIPAGNKWLDDITDALKDTKLLIILYSPLSRNRPWINFEAGCGWIKNIIIIPVCHSGLLLQQIGSPISSFQGLEISNNNFVDDFFGAISKHAGFAKQPKIDKANFLKEVNGAIEKLSSVSQMSDDIPTNTKEIYSGEQISILKVLAEAQDHGENGVDEPDLARRVNLKVTLLIHHIKPLKDKEMVKHRYAMGTGYYVITQKGISALVELDILK